MDQKVLINCQGAHKHFINLYRLWNVYNADEAGSFYQLLPKKIALEGKNCTAAVPLHLSIIIVKQITYRDP